jgi:hypothetical protein
LQIGEDGFDRWHAPTVDGAAAGLSNFQRMRSVGASLRARGLGAPSRCLMTVSCRWMVRSGYRRH